MLEKIKNWTLKLPKWMPIVIALVGFLVYLIRSWGYIHTLQALTWDETMYLYKGYEFASGAARPFADYGLWTNQLPVAYFAPGFFQVVFGAGIATGRGYAFALGALILVGGWLAARRQGNDWWAAGVVWVFALNTGWVKSYSMVLSQGLVTFFFAWMLVFTLGKGRRTTWQIALAAFLAAMAGLTRLNVLPVVFIFILYVFWQYGRKDGLIAAAAGLLPILAVHWLYWPDILKIWAYWVPKNIFPAIAYYRSPHREIFLPDGFSWWDVGEWLRDPDHLAWLGIASFVRALRANFVVVVSVVGVLLFWPGRGYWNSEEQRKLSIFLLVTFLAMFGIHFVAAIGGYTCRFVCFPGYMLFFNLFGVMVLVSTADVLKKKLAVSWQVFAFVLAALAFTAFVLDLDANYKPFRSFLVYDVFQAEVIRMQDQTARQQPEPQPFWRFLEERFGFSRYPYLRYALFNDQFAVLLRWAFIAFYIMLPLVLWRLVRKRLNPKADFGRFLIGYLLGFAVLISPFPFLSQALDAETCDGNVINRYEDIGAELAAEIEPGAQVFWHLKSDLLLLYLPGREVFLPQTDFYYTFVNDTTTSEDVLLRFGWWNFEIGKEWIEQADYIVMENRDLKNDRYWDWAGRLDRGELDIVLTTKPSELCRGTKSEIIVLVPLDVP